MPQTIQLLVLLMMATLTLRWGWGAEQETVLIDETGPQTPWSEGPYIGM